MNLDGPVRVADKAGAGTATVTLSFDAWKDAKVASTTHSVQVLPPKAGPKAEPVAENVVGTLVHPDRKATVHYLEFSKDGKQLFTAGYPSGIVQLWDWAARKELRRIDTPPGKRPTLRYAVVTPDWKTLYVPIESRKISLVEKDGKVVRRVDYNGRIGVWDLTTGEERTPLIAEGTAPFYTTLTPDGRHLLSTEWESYTTDARSNGGVWVWEPETGKRRKLWDSSDYPLLSPDGKRVILTVNDIVKKKHDLKVLDFATGKEVASFTCPEEESWLFASGFSQDGSLLAVEVRGRAKGSKRMILFLDAKTLADRGRYVGDPTRDTPEWISTTFSPDGKTCVLNDSAGKVIIWDLAQAKVVRSFAMEVGYWGVALSPDGKTMAAPWRPKLDGVGRDPDPQDLPQPRVTLYDLSRDNPPRTLIAPHGHIGALAFSPDGKTLAFGSSGGVRLFDLTK